MNDLRYGIRRLFALPGVTAVAVLSVALAVAANSVVFSFVHGVLFQPPPFHEPERLAMVWERDLTSTTLSTLGGKAPPGILPVSVPNLMDFRAQNRVFEHLVGLGSWKPTLTGDPESVRIRASGVNAELFQMLGVQPILGRDFRPEEDDPEHDKVAILGYGLWKDRYGGDPRVLGKTLRLDGKVYVVIGVMPEGFDFPDETVLWKPLGFVAKDWQRDFTMLHVLGRLKPGIGIEAAQQDLTRLTTTFAQLYPETSKGRGVWAVGLQEFMTAPYRPALLVLWMAVIAVLLIACANVSNLLLTRAVERQREVAVRLAIGADRGRLLRQLLTESLLLALLAAALGLFLAYFGVHILVPLLLQAKIPQLAKARLDLTVVAFTLGLSLLSVVLFSLGPALGSLRTDLTAAFKSGDRSRGSRSVQGLQKVTVVLQVAIAFVLLLGAGLLVKSFNRLMAVDPGFRTDGALAVEINLMPRASYTETAKTINFTTELERRVQAMPGVTSVGSTWNLPMAGGGGDIDFTTVGEAGDASRGASLQAVTPGYFSTMGIPLLRGRGFTPRDDAKAPPVAIINEEAARQFWPGQPAIGKRITFEVDFGPAGQFAPATREIVGVVGNVRHSGLDRELQPEVFLPNYQGTWRWSTLVVRGRNAGNLAGAIRREIRAMDPGLALGRVQPLEQFIGDSVAKQRLSTWVLTLFSIIALILAAIGAYGVLSYSVSQRTPEIGIRMALGARPREVLLLVLRQAMALAVLGVLIGLLAGLGLSRLLDSFLFNVSSLDPMVFIGVALMLLLVTLLASYLPARRATTVDPLLAIRTE